MLMLLLSTFAFAQSPETTPEKQYAKETIIDMTGAEIDGEIVKPQMTFIMDRQLGLPRFIVDIAYVFQHGNGTICEQHPIIL